jgi:hypothetical protein
MTADCDGDIAWYLMSLYLESFLSNLLLESSARIPSLESLLSNLRVCLEVEMVAEQINASHKQLTAIMRCNRIEERPLTSICPIPTADDKEM